MRNGALKVYGNRCGKSSEKVSPAGANINPTVARLMRYDKSVGWRVLESSDGLKFKYGPIFEPVF